MFNGASADLPAFGRADGWNSLLSFRDVMPPAHLTHNTSPAGVSCKTHVRHTPRAIPVYPTITAVLRTFSRNWSGYTRSGTSLVGGICGPSCHQKRVIEFGEYAEKIKETVGLGVVSDKQMLKSVLGIVGSVNITLQMIAAVSVLAAAFGIINTMMTATYERKREIGILQALGATQRTIFFLFMIESAFYGIIGGVAGVVAGLLTSTIAAPYISENAFTTLVKGSGNATTIDPAMIVGSILFSAVVAVAAGLYPAWRAARLAPVEAVSSSGWLLPVRWPIIPRSCSWMSRPATSIRRQRPRCSTSCLRCTGRKRPSWWSRTTTRSPPGLSGSSRSGTGRS